MLKGLILSTVVAGLFAFATISANAMPASSLAGVSKADQNITQVRGGCGRGWHRGPRGHCRRNGW
jgi:hypothetical protein